MALMYTLTSKEAHQLYIFLTVKIKSYTNPITASFCSKPSRISKRNQKDSQAKGANSGGRLPCEAHPVSCLHTNSTGLDSGFHELSKRKRDTNEALRGRILLNAVVSGSPPK